MPRSRSPLDVERLRRDFPLLQRREGGEPLVYLDNASTTQKPQAVIDAMVDFYTHHNANVHRGVHRLSQEATEAFERSRDRLRRYLNAAESAEIIFTRGTTESINLVASSWGRHHLRPGDEVVLTEMEHHSNIVPWQLICEQTGATIKVAPVDDRGQLDVPAYESMLNERTRIVSVVHVSNTLGTINPIDRLIDLAHQAGAVVLIDGAQSLQHDRVDVRSLECDFFAFSGHKMFGPTGIGGLYGRRELLESMPPYQGGGEMIKSVTFAKTIYHDPPHRFEAGTPNIAGAVGLGAAVDYLESLDAAAVLEQEQQLLRAATDVIEALPGVRLIGTAPRKAPVVSFVIEGIHPHDLGTILDHQGIAVRTGHHCTQPLMERFQVPATARVSLSFYNTVEEISRLAAGLHQVLEVFR